MLGEHLFNTSLKRYQNVPIQGVSQVFQTSGRQCFFNILMPLMKFRWPLYSDNIFFVDHYSAGSSNKHCLLPFFIDIVSLRNMPMHYTVVFKVCKNEIF